MIYKTFFIILIIVLLGGVGWFGYVKIKKYRDNNAKKVSITVLSENKAENTDATINNGEENAENIEQADNAVGNDAKENLKSETEKADTKQTNDDDKSETKTQSVGKTKVNLISWGFEGASSRKIDTIVVHSSYDALGGDVYDVEGILKEYKQYGVAAHYLIDREGTAWQLVAEKNIAYHAGQSKVPDGRTSVNNFSIGIELANTEKDNYTDAQYLALNSLISSLKNRYSIKYVLGHSEIAPGRKTDPWNIEWGKVQK